jgi:hypothetical protein
LLAGDGLPRVYDTWRPNIAIPRSSSQRVRATSAGVSLRTFDRWIARGLPTYPAHPRGKVLVRRSDIEAFLQRRQRQQPHVHWLVDDVLMSLRSSAKASRRKGRMNNTPPKDFHTFFCIPFPRIPVYVFCLFYKKSVCMCVYIRRGDLRDVYMCP